jgi:hypothetical protein
MDPTESNARLDALAAEFPDIAEMVPLPEKSPGHQRLAMAMMAGTTTGLEPVDGQPAARRAAVLQEHGSSWRQPA